MIPFCYSDGGRSDSSHKRERNDCTVRALALVCEVGYDEAYTLLRQDAGRPKNAGAFLGRWLINRQDPILGEPQDIFGYRARRLTFPATKGLARMNPAEFWERFPRGRYIVQTAKHVYAVIDGIVLDEGPPRPDRCIYSAWHFTRTDMANIQFLRDEVRRAEQALSHSQRLVTEYSRSRDLSQRILEQRRAALDKALAEEEHAKVADPTVP